VLAAIAVVIFLSPQRREPDLVRAHEGSRVRPRILSGGRLRLLRQLFAENLTLARSVPRVRLWLDITAARDVRSGLARRWR
jgi:hypothetical protein